MRIAAILLALIGFAPSFQPSFALRDGATEGRQDPAEEAARLKKAILDKVKARLEEEHRKILERVARIIDEELAGKAPPAKAAEPEVEKKIAELEAKLEELDKQKTKLRREIDQLRRQASGKDGEEQIKEDAKEKGPQDLQEAHTLHQEAIRQLEGRKEMDEAVLSFKYIYYQFPTENVGMTAAYNVACGYSLQGEKEKACDWLEISLKAGYLRSRCPCHPTSLEHLRQDSDLDNIRNEEKYKKLLADK